MKIGSIVYSKEVEAYNYEQLVKAIRKDIEREVRECVDVPSWTPSGDGSEINPGQEVLMTMWAMFDLFEKGLKKFPFDEETAIDIMDALQHTYTFWALGRWHIWNYAGDMLKEEQPRIDDLVMRLQKLKQLPDIRREKLFHFAQIEHEEHEKRGKTKRGYTFGKALEDTNEKHGIYSEQEFDKIFVNLEGHFRKWRGRKQRDAVSRK